MSNDHFNIDHWTLIIGHSASADDRVWKVRATSECFRARRRSVSPYSQLLKGGDPAAGSPTATLLRLRPSHRLDLRRLPPCGWPTGFGSLRLPWRDGRCVQGPGTYSPRRGWSAITSDSGFMPSSCRRQSELSPAFGDWLPLASSRRVVPGIVARVSPWT